MKFYSHIYNCELVRHVTFNPWDLLTFTQTYADFVNSVFVSARRLAFLIAASGIPDPESASYHGRAPIGLPGAKYHSMVGQAENTHAVRMQRAAGKDFRERVVLEHPDYYKFALMR